MSGFVDGYLDDKYKGKVIERIDDSHDTVEIFFTDGTVMTIVARGTEEQWIEMKG